MKEKKEWTVMIYLAGDNNLSDECIWSIKEMYRVGLSSQVAVVAQFDSKARGASVRRYDLSKIPGAIAATKVPPSPVYQQAAPYPPNGLQAAAALPTQAAQNGQHTPRIHTFTTDGELARQARAIRMQRSFASATALKEFILWCMWEHPAKRYMLVLAGHGSGAVGKNFLMEDNPAGYLSIPRFRWALEEVQKELKSHDEIQNNEEGKIDVIGFDSCAMSMAEVVYELKDVAQYTVGSEGFELAAGWPYFPILKELHGSSLPEPKDLVNTIVTRYVTYYSDYAVADVSADQAACDLSRTKYLATAVKELVRVLKYQIMEESRASQAHPPQSALLDAVILAHWRAQSYKYEDYVDLWDFCGLLAQASTDTDIREACAKVQAAINIEGLSDKALKENADAKPVVLKSCYSGETYQHSHGLSIYFPWVTVAETYPNLRFSKETKWHEFLYKYVHLTRRECRPGAGKLQGVDDGHEHESEHQHRFAPPDGRFAPPDGRFAPPDGRFAPPDGRFAPPDGRFAPPDGRFAPPDGRFAPPDGRFGATMIPQMKNPAVGYFLDPCIAEALKSQTAPADPPVIEVTDEAMDKRELG